MKLGRLNDYLATNAANKSVVNWLPSNYGL